MANLTINPTTGTGNGTITIAPIDMNRSNGDIISSVLVTNGVVTREVDCVQYGMPLVEKTSGSNPVPYSGGTFTYDVSTHYPFRMHNLTLGWYVVTNQWGTQLFADRWYPVESAGTITVTVGHNTITDARSEDLRIQFDTQPTYYDEPMGIYQEGMPTEAPYINLSPDTINLAWDDINTKQIQVNTNIYELYGEYPTLNVDYDSPADFWVAPLGSYSIYLNANSANTGNTPKTTVIYVSAGTQSNPSMLTASATVTQATDVPLSVSLAPVNVERTATAVSATVTANKEWWFNTQTAPFNGPIYDSNNNRIYTLDHQQPVTNAVYTMYISLNNTDSERTFRASLYYDGAQAGTYSNYVTQDCVHLSYTDTGTSYFSPEPYSVTGEECIITVTSNAAFTVDASSISSWASVSPLTGNSGTTVITVRATSQNDGDERQGSLIFAVGGNNIRSFYISQQGQTVFEEWSIDPMSAQFSWEMNSGSFDITPPDENYAWIAQVDADSLGWITIENMTDIGTGSGTVEYSVSDNTTGSLRAGSIEIIKTASSESEADVTVAIFTIEQEPE